MSRPRTILPLRILVPERFLTGEADDENVRPLIAVEIVRPGEKVVGVSVDVERVTVVVHKPLSEPRPGIPERPGDDIHGAVAIDVAKVRAFTEELVGELRL